MDCASFLKSLIQTNDFGCGFSVYGCFSQVFNLLWLFLMFFLGLKILQSGLCRKGLAQFLCDNKGRSNHGLDSKFGFGPLNLLENSKSQNTDRMAEDVLELECCEEDLENDVLELRRLVKIERQRACIMEEELEKERMAAASAADEAMAMILRLQNEKSAAEIEASRCRRLAEKQQEFDKEVIRSLQYIVMRHESERVSLEEKLVYVDDDDEKLVYVDDDGEVEGVDARMSFFDSATEMDSSSAFAAFMGRRSLYPERLSSITGEDRR